MGSMGQGSVEISISGIMSQVGLNVTTSDGNAELRLTVILSITIIPK